jgi:hypothetical protein
MENSLVDAPIADAVLAVKMFAQGKGFLCGKEARGDTTYIEAVERMLIIFNNRSYQVRKYTVETKHFDGNALVPRGWFTWVCLNEQSVIDAVWSSNKLAACVAHSQAIVEAYNRSVELENVLLYTIEVGYEQIAHAQTKSTDYDDALRIYADRFKGIDWMSGIELDLAKTSFEKEFKGKGSAPKKFRAKPGTPSFWKDLKKEFNLKGA